MKTQRVPKAFLVAAILLLVALPLSAQDTPPPPAGTPAPTTFWDDYGDNIIVALIGLVIGGILVWVLKPAFERLGNALAAQIVALNARQLWKQRPLRRSS